MAKLDGFRDGELSDVVSAEESIERLFNGDGRDEDVFRDVVIGIVFGEAGEINLRYGATVKRLELLGGKGGGNFNGAVGAKIVIDHGVAGADGADGATFIIYDDEGGEVLILDFGLKLAKFANSFFGGSELVRRLTVNHGVPTELNHGPVVAVAVGGHHHTATASSDPEIGAGKLSEKLL